MKEKKDFDLALQDFSEFTRTFVSRIINCIPEESYCFWEPGYHSIIWGKQPQGDDTHCYQFNSGTSETDSRTPHPKPYQFIGCPALIKSYKTPVGIVLKGILEVTESFCAGSQGVDRIRTTALLQEGDLFRLFESFAGLWGNWCIRAGIANIFVANRLADTKLWVKLGHIKQQPLRSERSPRSTSGNRLYNELEKNYPGLGNTLHHNAAATFDFSSLLDFVHQSRGLPENGADISLLIFDADKINDANLLNNLFKKTIKQLASIIEQNPAALDDQANPSLSAMEQKAQAQLIAMLRGHVPLLRLLSTREIESSPFAKLAEAFPAGEHSSHLDPLHIFIPSYFRATDHVYIYIEELSKKLDCFHLETFLKHLGRHKKITQHGLRVLSFDEFHAEKKGGSIMITIPNFAPL